MRNEKEILLQQNEKVKIKRRLILFSLLITHFSLLIAGCSSAPKKPVEIYTNRIIAANQLNLANQTANQGRYEDALRILEEARRLAISTDDPPLRIKTSISRGSILFSMGLHAEAFREWESAAAEGDSSDQKIFAALARIYIIRGELVLLSNESEPGVQAQRSAAEALKVRLSRELTLVKSDSISSAVGYVALSMAEKQIGNWAAAESAAKQALDIHDKNRYLEEAAYDWFLIASIRSVAGNYRSSIDALKMSISFDRRAENSFGLASSWQAMGDVHKKAGQAGESRTAYQRAADIFRAMGLEDRAEQLEL